MVTNFDFLQKFDRNLYTIIKEAELLYRDEYFEQCMVQTRRFGEHLCKKVLGDKRRDEKTFDDMLATLKDNITGEEQEREFIEDLYFLKKHGNNSAHSLQVSKNGIEALECLKHAFEAAISYCVYYCRSEASLLALCYDTELLVTGKKSKCSLAEKYNKEKLKYNKTAKKKRKVSQSSKMVSKKDKKGLSPFWIFVGICLIFSVLMLLFMELIS